MFYVNFAVGFYGPQQGARHGKFVEDCRYAEPFNSFEDADEFAKKFAREYFGPQQQYYTVVRTS